ncbi:mitochondrial substrate carrier family protein [Klebsormidium nitens]|uniref:Mitochondrial substrate carrier family protein n=1 Tax=Klebsormidium nitens TaxID=105231 RepID=A0A1Y1HZP1_KLENI|nr:mitochondrial substrate carrier family protein [Klebsormidium nitens]|eukprot:GAQ84125.1 mitochondrial substrate carrier family protein [Klebsormidium nitens]
MESGVDPMGVLPAEASIDWQQLDKAKFLWLGTVASSAFTALLHPVSLVKTRLQAQQSGVYRNSAHAVRKILQAEGPKGLYRGLGTVLLGTVPAEIVYVGLLEITKSGTRQTAEQGGWSDEAAAGLADSCGGLVAGVATQGVTVPVEVVSQRLMVQGAHSSAFSNRYQGSALDITRAIIRQEGLRGLYRGYGLSVLADAPSSMVWWLAYGATQRALWRALGYGSGRRGEPSPQELMGVQAAAGTFAGAIAGVVTTPLDVIKTRLQVLDQSSGKQPTIASTFRSLLQQDGAKGLFRGVFPYSAYMALSTGAIIVGYEYIKRTCVKSDLPDRVSRIDDSEPSQIEEDSRIDISPKAGTSKHSR